MAVQSFGVNNALTVKRWAKGLEAEVLKKISFNRFMGKGPDSLIQVKDELNKTPGDRVRVSARFQLDETTSPKQGNAGLEGNERTLDIYYDDVVVDQLRDAVRGYKVIDAQRVPFDTREEARIALADVLAAYIDQGFFNHVCGYTPALGSGGSDTSLTLNNTVNAPSDNDHQIWSESGTTADEDLDSTGDEFTLALLDTAVERAKTLSPAIRPARIEGLGEELYVCFLHPYQVTQLRASGTDWQNIQRDILRGGRIDDNPIITGALGLYNGTLLVESSRVTQGVDSGDSTSAVTDVRRAVLCGAQAAVMAWGRDDHGTPNRFRWVEEMFDYENEFGVSGGFVGGLSKLVFNSIDYATIVISTYATSS